LAALKKAVITGITGQDGAYLSALLLDKGYEVFGLVRRTSSTDLSRLEYLGIVRDVTLVEADMLEESTLARAIKDLQPDELYNLAAQSFVQASFDQPLYTTQVNAMGAARLLEAIRHNKPDTRFYQASTSEMFGAVEAHPQDEETPFHPRSPYGVAKLYAHWLTRNYREAFGLHASSGILFNHESPIRGQEFVTRKITSTLARIRCGSDEVLELGNLEARRDWGYAGDYVQGMWQMLQRDKPGDFVLATGETHSVREFVDEAANCLDFSLRWSGKGNEETATDNGTGRTLVRVNPLHYRPSEVSLLIGDASKAKRELGWKPGVSFSELVKRMVRADLDMAMRAAALP